MREHMSERLVRLLIAADREIRECADSGEHPAAALRAICDVTANTCCGPNPLEWYQRASRVRGGVERAASVYPVDAEGAAVILRQELKALAPLVKIAQEAREAELCGC